MPEQIAACCKTLVPSSLTTLGTVVRMAATMVHIRKGIQTLNLPKAVRTSSRRSMLARTQAQLWLGNVPQVRIYGLDKGPSVPNITTI